MSEPYVLSRLALQDLTDIWDRIARRNLEAADRVIDEIDTSFLKLAAHHEMGHIREDLAPRSYRFWPIYSYLIIYRPNTSPLEIARVWHGAQRKPRLL